jgi:hypothetical protein
MQRLSCVQVPSIKKQEKKEQTHNRACSFLVCCSANLDATPKKSIKSRGVQLLKRFYVHPK